MIFWRRYLFVVSLLFVSSFIDLLHPYIFISLLCYVHIYLIIYMTVLVWKNRYLFVLHVMPCSMKINLTLTMTLRINCLRKKREKKNRGAPDTAAPCCPIELIALNDISMAREEQSDVDQVSLLRQHGVKQCLHQREWVAEVSS